MRLVGVVLAGGESRRFGSNKLAYPVGGVPMIVRVVRALRGAGVDEVVVSTRGGLVRELKKLVEPDLYITDEELPCRGPLRGLATALSSVEAPEYIVVPGDTPMIKPETIARLIRIGRKHNATVASPYWKDGFVETLIAYVSGNVGQALRRCCVTRGQIAKASDLQRGAPRLLLVGVSELSEDLREFISVDRPSDLPPQTPKGAPTIGMLSLGGEHSRLFWTALESLHSDPARSSDLYLRESHIYLELGIYHLAYHALLEALGMAPPGKRRAVFERLSALKKLLAARGVREV